MPEIIAVFDLDRTLLKENSTQLFGAHFFKKGSVGLIDYSVAYLLYCCYLLRAISLKTLIEKATNRFFKGKNLDELKALSNEYWASKCTAEGLWNPTVLWHWKDLSQRSACLGIMTSAPSFIVDPIARHLKADFVLSTQFKTTPQNADDLRHILALEAAVTGESKKAYLEKVKKKYHGAQIFGFGDSLDDWPFLSICQKIFLVKPSRSLLQRARKHINSHDQVSVHVL